MFLDPSDFFLVMSLCSRISAIDLVDIMLYNVTDSNSGQIYEDNKAELFFKDLLSSSTWS